MEGFSLLAIWDLLNCLDCLTLISSLYLSICVCVAVCLHRDREDEDYKLRHIIYFNPFCILQSFTLTAYVWLSQLLS